MICEAQHLIGVKMDGEINSHQDDFDREQVTWRSLEPGRETPLAGVNGRESGLFIEAVAVPGKLPIHLEQMGAGDPEDNVGLRIREASTGRRLAYFPAAGGLTPNVRKALDGAD